MPKPRRAFSPAFKREAVALLESRGRPLMQVATEVGISPSMLRNWRASVRGAPVRSGAGAPTISPLPSPADQASEITRLKRELDHAHGTRRAEKGDRHLRGGAGMSFGFIRDHAGRWPVRPMCRVLEVSASGYHAWRGRPDSAGAATNRALLADTRRLHAEHHGRHGSSRMHSSRFAPKAGRRAVAASRG